MQDVDGLGQAGKELSVNHGYARNYLIPKRLVDVRQRRGSAGAGGGSAEVRAAQVRGASLWDRRGQAAALVVSLATCRVAAAAR